MYTRNPRDHSWWMRHEAVWWVGDYLHVSVVILGVLGGRWSLKLRLEDLKIERLRILISQL